MRTLASAESGLPLALTPMSGATYRRLASHVTELLGIRMGGAKASMLQGRLMKRLRHLRLSSMEEYAGFLFESGRAAGEQVHLIDAVTTNKTDFFRESEHFRVLARIASRGKGRTFQVWCAGCSTGEEAYTLAMTLDGLDYSILATDISTRALRHAQTAIYGLARIHPVPLPLRSRFLLRSRDPRRQCFRIRPELRRRVNFQRLNFMDATYRLPAPFDAVFFRNVLIYFDRRTQREVAARICGQLAVGGHLFVSHSESLAGFDLPLETVAPAVYRRLPAARPQ